MKHVTKHIRYGCVSLLMLCTLNIATAQRFHFEPHFRSPHFEETPHFSSRSTIHEEFGVPERLSNPEGIHIPDRVETHEVPSTSDASSAHAQWAEYEDGIIINRVKYDSEPENASEAGHKETSSEATVRQAVREEALKKIGFHILEMKVSGRKEHVIELRKNVFVRINDYNDLANIRKFDNAPFHAEDVGVLNLVAQRDTVIRAKELLSANQMVFDFSSEDNLRHVLADKRNHIVFALGHVEKGEFITRNLEGKVEFRVSVSHLQNIAQDYNITLVALGCKSADYSSAGVLNAFNTVDAVQRLTYAMKASTYGDMLARIAEPTTRSPGLSLIIDATVLDGHLKTVALTVHPINNIKVMIGVIVIANLLIAAEQKPDHEVEQYLKKVKDLDDSIKGVEDTMLKQGAISKPFSLYDEVRYKSNDEIREIIAREKYDEEREKMKSEQASQEGYDFLLQLLMYSAPFFIPAILMPLSKKYPWLSKKW